MVSIWTLLDWFNVQGRASDKIGIEHPGWTKTFDYEMTSWALPDIGDWFLPWKWF